MGKLHLIRFTREDQSKLDIIRSWWSSKVGVTMGNMVFSDSGFMIMDDYGRFLVSAFLYPIQGCAVAMMGFPCADPELSSDVREHALSFLTTSIELEAKSLNYRFLISYAGSKGAVEMFKRENYKIYDHDVVNFGKEL